MIRKVIKYLNINLYTILLRNRIFLAIIKQENQVFFNNQARKTFLQVRIIYQLIKSQFNHMQNEPQKFYKNLIAFLEKYYINQNQTKESLWNKVLGEISSKLKMEISFDYRFAQTLKEYFKEINAKYQGTQAFLKKIKFVKFINKLFFQNKFISKRQFERLSAPIQNIINSPCNEWQDNLTYLKHAGTLSEFRQDFLYRYCKVNSAQADALIEQTDTIEGKQRLKTIYQNFFKQFLEVDSSSMRVANFVETYWSQWQSKTQMLTPDLIKALQKHLGADVGRSADQVAINNALANIAQENSFQNDNQMKQKLQAEVKIIEKALQKFSGLNILKDKKIQLRLGRFGSIVSGFAGVDADLDLTILTNCYVNELQLLKIIYQFLKKEYQVGDRRSPGRRVIPELISTAKTPLINITISERSQKQIKIDIIINNILGIINSKFLNVYAGVKWVKNLGILVKIWGKEVGLVAKSSFSSYAIILMLIHYLIKSKKINPIMDARGRKADAPHFKFKRLKASQIQQFDVYYGFKTRKEDVASNERVNYYQILMGFMKYYGFQIQKENENNRIITVDQSTDRQIDKETAITIKDPFDKPHNPGRLKKQSLPFMFAKFKEAHELLSRGDVQRIKDLFIRY